VRCSIPYKKSVQTFGSSELQTGRLTSKSAACPSVWTPIVQGNFTHTPESEGVGQLVDGIAPAYVAKLNWLAQNGCDMKVSLEPLVADAGWWGSAVQCESIDTDGRDYFVCNSSMPLREFGFGEGLRDRVFVKDVIALANVPGGLQLYLDRLLLGNDGALSSSLFNRFRPVDPVEWKITVFGRQ